MCTRFGALTTKKGLCNFFDGKLKHELWPANLDANVITDIVFRKFTQDALDFADFITCIKELYDTFSDYCIVIHPHPSENVSFYAHAFSAFPNAEVTNEGNVLSWIRGSALVIHSNCTTGIEAALAHRPVINFLPGQRDRSPLNVEVASQAGVIAKTLMDEMHAVETLLSGSLPTQHWTPHAKDMLNNLDHDAIPLLLNEISAVIDETQISGSHVTLPPHRLTWSLRNRLLRRAPPKPGQISRDHVESIVEGTLAQGGSAARIIASTPHYVVLDPA